ncbi:rhomboid family intramembrane serine protease [Puia sp.]|jgi:membrane associated rhomboid family serine protease|uniref:rhomboid family intramembrane serine protease n=1 Tax=Puia sp. TaxID=2045100 RepID=UPI002F3F31EF
MIPPVIKNLIILNVLVFLAQQTLGRGVENSILNLFALHDVHSAFFRPHQLITYMFLHGGWDHIFFNMFALWMFGAVLENYWGSKRFLIYYVICGIGAAVCHLIVLYIEMAPLMDQFHQIPLQEQQELLYSAEFRVNEATLGASGAIFGCLAAFGYLFPNSLIYLYFFVPIKAKWAVLGYAAIELYSGIRSSAGDNVAHWAHLGGALVGIIVVMIWNRNNRRNFY